MRYGAAEGVFVPVLSGKEEEHTGSTKRLHARCTSAESQL